MPYYRPEGPPRQSILPNEQDPTNGQGAANGFIGSQSAAASSESSKIVLPILPVKVKASNGRSVTTYAFLDNGSDSTFCTESLVQTLGINGKKTKLRLTTLERENSMHDCELVNLEVYDIHENVFFDLPYVYTRPTMPVSAIDIPTQKAIDSQPHLQHIKIPDIDASVDLLIGNDNAHVIQPTEIIQSKGKGPYAVKTAFGWAINGPVGSLHSRSHKANFIKLKSPATQTLKHNSKNSATLSSTI